MAIVLLVPVVTAMVPASLPGNSVSNGDFESGLAPWSHFCPSVPIASTVVGSGSPMSPGSALRIVNTAAANCVRQPFEPFDAPVLELAWWAKGEIVQGRTCAQTIRAVGNLNTDVTVFVMFFPDTIRFRLWDGEMTIIERPLDLEWHLYSVTILRDLGLAVLAADDLTIGVATGAPLEAPQPFEVWIGDTAGNDFGIENCGAAPQILWDEIYWGPAPL